MEEVNDATLDTTRLDWILNATVDEINDLPEWTREHIDNAIKSNVKDKECHE